MALARISFAVSRLACQNQQLASFATKANTTKKEDEPAAVPATQSQHKDLAALGKVDWTAIKVPEKTLADLPTITNLNTSVDGIAFYGDIRSTSGLGLGDGVKSHTAKWLHGNDKSPMEWIAETEPIKVKGHVVASYGSDDPALGCPVEYINLKGTSYEQPAVCKYTGNKYYSDDWKHGGGHH